jgi:hypothetical protein
MSLAAFLQRVLLRRTASPSRRGPIIESQRARIIPTGPARGSKLTEAFVREVGRFAYLWAWPLANVYTAAADRHLRKAFKGFWSITLYDKYHFLAPNEIDRFSLGTKSKQLRFEADGSLVVCVQQERPDEDRVSNWVLAPGDEFLYPRLLAAAADPGR